MITRTITETCACDGVTVDAAESVLRRVKVLGYESVNRRRYTMESAQQAIGLYEGAKVNLDHPEGNPSKSRGLVERFGKLQDVTVESDGVWANLRYNPRHLWAPTVAWWAEFMPDCLGLSHNAIGQGHDEHGVFVVERIVSVRSVDLVADPATTRGLFESTGQGGTMKVKLKSFFESAKWEKRTAPLIQSSIKKLMEMGYMDPEMEMDGPDGGGGVDHAAALKDGFDASCYAIIDDEKMSADDKVKRLKKLLKTHEKLASGKPDEGVTETDDLEDDDEEEPNMESVQVLKKHKNKAVRSLAERLEAKETRLDALEAKDRLAERTTLARRLCGEAKLPNLLITDVFMEQLVHASDEKAMKALIMDRKNIAGTQKVRSSGPSVGLCESVAGVAAGPAAITDGKSFAAAVKRAG